MKQKTILVSIVMLLSLLFATGLNSQNIPGKSEDRRFECRINVGGDRWVDAQGREWLPDKIYREGYGYLGLSATFTSDEAISGTNNQHIYQSGRYQLYGYRADVPNGHYEIVLHFAEIDYDRAGARIMAIKIEGKPVLNRLDIYARVGKNAALQLTFNTKELNIPIVDGRIDIAIESQRDDTQLSALEVIQLADQPSLLKIEPSFLNFGSAINSLPITINNMGSNKSEWSIKTSVLPDWIFIPEATTGTIAPEAKTSVTIRLNRAGMSSGVHKDSLTITAPGFEEKIPVSMIVAGAAKLSLLTSILDFKDNLCHLPCLLTNCGGSALIWAIDTNKIPSWIERIYPAKGTVNIADTTFINLTVSRKGLPPGSHTAVLPILSETGIENVSIKISLPQKQSRHLFVAANASGLKNGKSWDNAFTRIQDAIAAVKPLGLNETIEIWVAEGIYFENNLRVPSGIHLYGGFAGDETARSERMDSWSHPTIVDGQKQGRCFECEHKTVIDGFVIQNGRDWAAGEGKGAAILAYENNVQIRNNLIQDNIDSWAGAVFIDGFEIHKKVTGFSPLIENNVLINNFSIYCAAAIEMRGSAATVRNNTIVNNQGFGLEIQPILGRLPEIIYGDFYNNIITNNFRGEQNDVWGEARKSAHYNYVGRRWSLSGDFKPYDYGLENIFGDITSTRPGFIDETNGDFRLRIDSPCINAGNPYDSNNEDGTRSDMGAFPFDHNQAELRISPMKLDFDSKSDAEKITIHAYGGQQISWRIATYSSAGELISASPSSGILQNGEKAKVTITVDRAGLPDAVYTGYLAVMTPGQSIETKISWQVNSSMPEIKLSHARVEAEAIMDGTNPEPQQIQIMNGGFENLAWRAQKKLHSNWLQISPASGQDGEILMLHFDVSNLGFGDFHEAIQIEAAGAINPTVYLPVTLKMRPGRFIYEVEAEQGASLPNTGWELVENNGKLCILSCRNDLELPDDSTKVDYEFYVPESVEYIYVFAELDIMQSREKASFWIQVNGHDLCPWDYIFPPNDGWFRSWGYHISRDKQHLFIVTPGKNTLNLYSRKKGGFINWFVITNDPDINIDTYQFGTKQLK